VKRGTKPKSAHLRLVTGNAGHRPVNEAEPVPAGEVKRPPVVKGRAKKLWLKYAPDLEKKGVLTAWDVENFAMWCIQMAEYQENPKASNAASRTQLIRLGECFGLIPPGRARLKVNGKEESEDPAEQYFK